jgi:hypothetical protein
MRNVVWSMGIVIPVCGAITLVVLAKAGYTAEYQTLLILAVSGWAIIGLYCGGKIRRGSPASPAETIIR